MATESSRCRRSAQRLLRLADGAREFRAQVASSDQGLLLREADGALTWVTSTGTEMPLVPASCGGAPIGLWGEGPAVLMACGEKAPWKLVRYDAMGGRDLGAALDRLPWRYRVGRIQPVGENLMDLASGAEWPHTAGVAGQLDEALLEVTSEGVARLRDLGNGRVRALTRPTGAGGIGYQFGRHVALDGSVVTVVDLEGRRVLGTLPRMPIVVREDGGALLRGTPGSDGPLRWYLPPGSMQGPPSR